MPTLLFFHIAAAIGLFIAIGIEWLTLGALKTVRDVQGLRSATVFAPVVNKLAPASVVVLLATGIALVARSKEFAFGDAWVLTALVLVVLVTVEAVTVHGRRMDQLALAARTAPDGPLSPELLAKINDPVMQISAFAASFMAVGAVWIMTHKPGWPGTIGTVVVATAVGAAVGVLLARRQARPASVVLPSQASVRDSAPYPSQPRSSIG